MNATAGAFSAFIENTVVLYIMKERPALRGSFRQDQEAAAESSSWLPLTVGILDNTSATIALPDSSPSTPQGREFGHIY